MDSTHLGTIRSMGVFSVVSKTTLSGKDLCDAVNLDKLGSFPADPSARGLNCFYGGQSYVSESECSAKDASSRRICPCSMMGKRIGGIYDGANNRKEEEEGVLPYIFLFQ